MPNADWFFTIGATHNVCEDYAYAEGRPGAAVAIISDGCSGSRDTDFGSRLLVRSAADRLWSDGMGFDSLRTIYQAAGMAKQIGLKDTSLDATLLCAKALKRTDGVVCEVWVHGDGMVVTRKTNGNVVLADTVFKGNMPLYLGYLLNNSRSARYIREIGEEVGEVTRQEYDGNFENLIQNETLPLGFREQQHFTFHSDDVDLVLLMSDGVQSFQRKVPETGVIENVPVTEVIAQVLKIKGMKGEFLKRRCNRFITKFCVKNNWQNNDDLAVVAIDMRVENE